MPAIKPVINSYVTVFARQVLDERNLRKKAETDAQLLANRIQHLKDEMARASRRSKEADSRSREIEKQKMESLQRKVDKVPRLGGAKKIIEEEGVYGTWVPTANRSHIKVSLGWFYFDSYFIFWNDVLLSDSWMCVSSFLVVNCYIFIYIYTITINHLLQHNMLTHHFTSPRYLIQYHQHIQYPPRATTQQT